MTTMTIMTYPSDSPPKAQWTVAEAKAKFSEVIEKARSGRPQTITRNGRSTAVIVSADEWEKKTKRRGSLVDFLSASPLRGVKLNLNRKRELPRPVEL